MPRFDYRAAKAAGVSDDAIKAYLQKNPDSYIQKGEVDAVAKESAPKGPTARPDAAGGMYIPGSSGSVGNPNPGPANVHDMGDAFRELVGRHVKPAMEMGGSMAGNAAALAAAPESGGASLLARSALSGAGGAAGNFAGNLVQHASPKLFGEPSQTPGTDAAVAGGVNAAFPGVEKIVKSLYNRPAEVGLMDYVKSKMAGKLFPPANSAEQMQHVIDNTAAPNYSDITGNKAAGKFEKLFAPNEQAANHDLTAQGLQNRVLQSGRSGDLAGGVFDKLQGNITSGADDATKTAMEHHGDLRKQLNKINRSKDNLPYEKHTEVLDENGEPTGDTSTETIPEPVALRRTSTVAKRALSALKNTTPDVNGITGEDLEGLQKNLTPLAKLKDGESIVHKPTGADVDYPVRPFGQVDNLAKGVDAAVSKMDQTLKPSEKVGNETYKSLRELQDSLAHDTSGSLARLDPNAKVSWQRRNGAVADIANKYDPDLARGIANYSGGGSKKALLDDAFTSPEKMDELVKHSGGRAALDLSEYAKSKMVDAGAHTLDSGEQGVNIKSVLDNLNANREVYKKAMPSQEFSNWETFLKNSQADLPKPTNLSSGAATAGYVIRHAGAKMLLTVPAGLMAGHMGVSGVISGGVVLGSAALKNVARSMTNTTVARTWINLAKSGVAASPAVTKVITGALRGTQFMVEDDDGKQTPAQINSAGKIVPVAGQSQGSQ